jgi:integrase
MKLYQRSGGIWWADFSVNGQRFRVSLGTTNETKASRRANNAVAEAARGNLTQDAMRFAKLVFGLAADRYTAARKLELSETSQVKEKQLLVKPRQFFGTTRLISITAERVLEYREWRGSQGCRPAIINAETGVLRGMLRRARRWHLIEGQIKRLKEPDSIGRALTEEQKLKLLEVARSRPEWETAYFAAVLTLHSTMRGCELRSLRWMDVDLFERILIIEKSKTDAGERVIPLTDEAYEVLTQLRQRAELFGAVEDSHFVFASFRSTSKFDDNVIRERGISSFDPTRPVGSWKKAWRTLTDKAGLKGLRFHDLRHTAITQVAESGAGEQVIMGIAGHISRKMLERYSHIRLEAKRGAIQALSS